MSTTWATLYIPYMAKDKANAEMPPSPDKAGLQRMLGMIKYLAQYIPGEATITAPLRQLLRKDNVWQWQNENEEAVKKLKDALTSAPVLRFFDPMKQLIIQVDASKDDLGACLLQEDHPIAYASRALSETEKNYAQIEKELLAIVFSVKKFHQYVYGVRVNVQSDHKPLETILRKPLGAAPSRLQRMLLQLQRYDINVTYTPGKELLIADTLSQAVMPEQSVTIDDITDEKVIYALEPTDALSTEALEQLRSATKKRQNTAAGIRYTQTWLAQTQETSRSKTDTILAYQTHSGCERRGDAHWKQDNPTNNITHHL